MLRSSLSLELPMSKVLWMFGRQLGWVWHQWWTFCLKLELGDNLVVSAAADSEENLAFHILVCTRKMFTCTQAFKCKWGKTFQVGDKVIQGRYFQRFGIGADTYLYWWKSHLAHKNVDYIRAVKFSVIITNHRVASNDPMYKLPTSMEEAIDEYAQYWS